MDWEIIYGDLKVKSWLVLLVLSSLSYFLMSPAWTTGIITGGFLVIANFGIFQNILRKAFNSESQLKARKAAIFFNFYFRLLFLSLIIILLLKQRWINPIGLTIGISTVVIAIAFLAISMALKTKSKEIS